MKVEQDKAPLRSASVEAPSPDTTTGATDWIGSQLAAEVLRRLTGEGECSITRAPGRLDVMGGSAEYTGSLVLSMTVADHVCVGVRRRKDGRVSIENAHPADADGARPIVFDQARLGDGKGRLLSPDETRSLWGGAGHDVARQVVGTLLGILATEVLRDFGAGLSIVAGSTMAQSGDLGQQAALGAAVVAATARAFDVEVDALQAAKVLHAVEPGWFSGPVSMADAICTLSGEPHSLTQVQHEPCKLVGSLRLPDDLLLVGIDCGVTHPQIKTKYEHVRTAAFMGCVLIDRILRHEGPRHLQWDGYLSRVSVMDYVERFRDRIPTKIKGSEFLTRFGETGDPLTKVDPDTVYKVRSRTEHHIYEHDRANQFVERLSHAIRNRDPRALGMTGELMYASHWSYGQRCGLGSIETDILVNLLRRHGAGADIYGAKTTGRGCGGVVAVLMRASERAASATDHALRDYQTRTGRRARMIRGSLPGALVSGVRLL